MVVEDVVKVFVDVVEHVDHLHGSAVVAEGGESHDVAEVDGHLFEQLWFHFARLLQWTHNRAEGDIEVEAHSEVIFFKDTKVTLFSFTDIVKNL